MKKLIFANLYFLCKHIMDIVEGITCSLFVFIIFMIMMNDKFQGMSCENLLSCMSLMALSSILIIACSWIKIYERLLKTRFILLQIIMFKDRRMVYNSSMVFFAEAVIALTIVLVMAFMGTFIITTKELTSDQKQRILYIIYCRMTCLIRILMVWVVFFLILKNVMIALVPVALYLVVEIIIALFILHQDNKLFELLQSVVINTAGGTIFLDTSRFSFMHVAVITIVTIIEFSMMYVVGSIVFRKVQFR